MNKGEELEKYVEFVYSSLLNMKDEGVLVSRDTTIIDSAGESHQIDVYYQFERAGVTHKVCIECKNHRSPVKQSVIREFYTKLHDISGVIGVVVSGSGYQSGAISFAKKKQILLLKTSDLPAINILLADKLKSVALPDESYIGEPFWTIMELREGRITGSFYGGVELQGSNGAIPLAFSKVHAQQYFHEKRLNPSEWAVRGLPRRSLKALIYQLELFERNNKWASLLFKLPGINLDKSFYPLKITREELASDYYGEAVPRIKTNNSSK